MNVNILGISEVKWTEMCEFNSDDHYIYYCGQESLRRNGVEIIVNKRVQNAVQFSSAAQWYPTLCDLMNCSTPGLPIHHQLPELLKLMSIELVMASSHLILCHPLLLLPPIPPSIRIFSSESTLCMTWPKYWSFSFSISPSNEHLGLISFRWTGWITLQSKGLSRVFSNTAVPKHQFSVLAFLHSPTLTSIRDHWKMQYLDAISKTTE